MSGRQEATITISEEEYRSLHEVDMKQRFGRNADVVESDYRKRVQALEQEIAGLQGKLARVWIGYQAGQPDHQADQALRQRLQTARNLSQALQQTGYRDMGYAYADPAREIALVQLVRTSDGSQIQIIIPKTDASAAWYSGNRDATTTVAGEYLGLNPQAASLVNQS